MPPVASVIQTFSQLAVVADINAAVAESPNLRLIGWGVRTGGGGAGNFIIRNSATGASGEILVNGEIGNNDEKGRVYSGAGKAAPNGLSFDHIAGTFDVTLEYDT